MAQKLGFHHLIIFKLTVCPQLDRIRRAIVLGTKSGVSNAAPNMIVILEDDKVVHGCICQGLLGEARMVRRSRSLKYRARRLIPSASAKGFSGYKTDSQRPQRQLCRRHYKAEREISSTAPTTADEKGSAERGPPTEASQNGDTGAFAAGSGIVGTLVQRRGRGIIGACMARHGSKEEEEEEEE
ncbi:hypothetical protein MMC30_004087 [Trapelia coarctata]|nr:hypothetical protein [Trapelia coarctata]